jgi:hypothetical protein
MGRASTDTRIAITVTDTMATDTTVVDTGITDAATEADTTVMVVDTSVVTGFTVAAGFTATGNRG